MKRFILLSFVGFYLFFCSSSIVFARDRSSSGSFNTSSGNSGSFQSDISRGKGQGIRETNWQTERGVGSLDAQSNWNLENKTGTIDSTIVLPSGNTISGDKSINKNEDGGYSVQSTYTGQDGYTIDTEKNISKSEQGLVSEGTYSTSTGKAGSFESVGTFEDGNLYKDQSMTTTGGITVERDITTTFDNSSVSRTSTLTGPQGETVTSTQDIDFYIE